MAKEEDRGNYKEEIENRKSEIERKLIDFFGGYRPNKIYVKNRRSTNIYVL